MKILLLLPLLLGFSVPAIAHLDEVRGFMEELSPELGVTDPVSGNIVSKVGYHDWYSFLKKVP